MSIPFNDFHILLTELKLVSSLSSGSGGSSSTTGGGGDSDTAGSVEDEVP